MDEHSFSGKNNDSTATPLNMVDMLNQMGVSDPRLQIIAELYETLEPSANRE